MLTILLLLVVVALAIIVGGAAIITWPLIIIGLILLGIDILVFKIIFRKK